MEKTVQGVLALGTTTIYTCPIGKLARVSVRFTDSVPKKSFMINVKSCTITNRNQLNVIGRNGNGGSNVGIIFGESGMEGFPLNQFPTEPSYSFENGFQVGGMNN